MANLKYENWYLNKKSENAELLFEKLNNMPLSEEDTSAGKQVVKVNLRTIANEITDKIGGSEKDAERLAKIFKKYYDPESKIIKIADPKDLSIYFARVYKQRNLQEDIISKEKIVYENLKNKIKNKKQLAKLIKEESQKILLNEFWAALGNFITGALSFAGKFVADYGIKLVTAFTVGSLIYKAGDEIGDPLLKAGGSLARTTQTAASDIESRKAQIAAQVGSGTEGAATAVGGVGQALGNVGTTAKDLTTMGRRAVGALSSRQLKMWCKRTTPLYNPAKAASGGYNVGDIFLGTIPSEPRNIYAYEVTEVDSSGGFNTNEVLCERPLPAS